MSILFAASLNAEEPVTKRRGLKKVFELGIITICNLYQLCFTFTFHRRGLRSVIALLPLLGVTWLVGFFLDFHYAVGYLFILLNSTQVQ